MKPNIASTILLCFSLAGILSISGCGKWKRQSDKTVTVENESKQSTDSLRNLIQILSLYGNPESDGSFTKDGLTHMVEKFRPQLQSFFSGSGLKTEQLVDLLFSFDKNQDGSINPREVLDTLKKRIKSIGWTNGYQMLTQEQVYDRISTDYPAASRTAKEGLVKTLMRFDCAWAEGSNDGLLDARELSTPGIVMSLVENTDLSNGFKTPDSAKGDLFHPTPFDLKRPLLIENQMNTKLQQQLIGRYDSIDPKKLSAIDNKLEWMQLGLKFVLSDRAVKNITWDTSEEGSINQQQLINVLNAMGGSEVVDAPGFSTLVKYYDSPLVGGVRDMKFDALELFQMITDLELGLRIKNTRLLRNQETISLLFPYEENVERLEDLVKTDLAAFTLELRYSNLTKTAFHFYDADQNGKLKKSEMMTLLREVYPTLANPETVQFFFADAIPEDPTKPFDLGKGWGEYFKVMDQITPAEVMVRVRKIIPRLLN